MKVTCNRKEFLAAFGMVAGVVPARSPKPVLLNVKLRADDSGVSLTATDLEVGVRRAVSGVQVIKPGELLLPAVRISQILGASEDEEVTIEGGNGDGTVMHFVHVKMKSGKWKLPSEDPDLFPEVPGFTADAYHAVSSADLRTMIRRTMFATDLTSTRFALGGVLIELDSDWITMVGTDGHRLAKMSAAAEAVNGAKSLKDTSVIPLKALKLIERNLSDPDLTVHLAIQGKSAVLVRTADGATVIYSRLVEGRFPAYRSVFPTEVATKIPLDVASLRTAVQQSSIVVTEESRGVETSWGQGKLVLQSSSADVGSSCITIPIDYDGPDISITFDPRYLADPLKVIDDGQPMKISLIDHKHPAVIETDDYYQVIIMPLSRDR